MVQEKKAADIYKLMFKWLIPMFSGASQAACAQTVKLLLENFTFDQIYEKLRKEGFSYGISARAVTFLPSAFVRVHYGSDAPIIFNECYYRGMRDYKKGRLHRYSEDRVFVAATNLAIQMLRDGDKETVRQIAEISAEYQNITKIIEKGETPKESQFTIHEF